MASKVFDLIPLLRAPLLINSGIGLIMSAIATASLDDWWDERTMKNVMAAVLAFYAASLLSTAGFAFIDVRGSRSKLNQGRLVVPTYLVKAGADLVVGVALLALHIISSVNVADSGSDIVLCMYAGFGALPASIFHLVLALHSASAALKAWKMSNDYCPTCHQRLRRCDSPDLHGIEEAGEPSVLYTDRKGGGYSVANREGSLEGDRLIVPAGDEA